MNRRSVTTSAGFKTRSEGEELIIEGYFVKFNTEAEGWPGYFEQIDPHAFDDELGGDVRALLDHQTHIVLGRTKAGTLTLEVDEVGLKGRITINSADREALDAYERVKRGDVDQCSFGFDVINEEYEDKGDGALHCTLKKVKLYEVSVCTFPFYPDTEVEARKKDAENMKKRQLEHRRAAVKKRLEELTCLH